MKRGAGGSDAFVQGIQFLERDWQVVAETSLFIVRELICFNWLKLTPVKH